MTSGGYSAKAVAWCSADVGGSIPPTVPKINSQTQMEHMEISISFEDSGFDFSEDKVSITLNNIRIKDMVNVLHNLPMAIARSYACTMPVAVGIVGDDNIESKILSLFNARTGVG